MKLRFLPALIFLLSLGFKTLALQPVTSFSADSTGKISGTKPNCIIWLNTGQLFRKEIQLSYERAINPEVSLEFGLGYKYPENKGMLYEIDLSSVLKLDTYDYAERMPFSQGIFLSAGLKGYNVHGGKSRIRSYVSPGLFYRYRFYDYQFVTSYTLQPDDRRTGTSLQSLDLHIYGIKMLMGHTFDVVRFNNKNSVLLDLYYGFGFRYKKAKTAYYNYNIADPASTPIPPATPPTVENAESKLISVHLGLKLGFKF